MSEYKARVSDIIIMRNDQTLNCEGITRVSIVDEGAGEFITIDQRDHVIRIDPEEWDKIRGAVNQLMSDVEYQAKEDGAP